MASITNVVKSSTSLSFEMKEFSHFSEDLEPPEVLPFVESPIAVQWNKTKNLPPSKTIPLLKMMLSIETKNPSASLLTLFRQLTERFRDTYGVIISSTTGPCSATEIAELQDKAQKVDDESLVTVWKKIDKKLKLSIPPITADEIRAWMNNPANADPLNTILCLRLEDLGLRSIPPEIKFLTQLRVLNLSKNQIKMIPDTIDSLTLLYELDLSHNQFKTIPAAICNLVNLNVLYLKNNQIQTIPDAIRDLKQLELCNLDNNPISDFYLQSDLEVKTLDQFKGEILYNSTSPLAKLCQAIIQGKADDQIDPLLYGLPVKQKNNIFYHVWYLSKKTVNDLPFVKLYVSDDGIIFLQAVRQTIVDGLAQSTPEEKASVYGRVYELSPHAKSFLIDGLLWGEQHAFNNLLRLADALAAVKKSS